MTRKLILNFFVVVVPQNHPMETVPEAQSRMQLVYLREERPVGAVVETGQMSLPVAESCLNIVTVCFRSSSKIRLKVVPQICGGEVLGFFVPILCHW